MNIAVANAPVSYGVFEMTIGSERYLGPAERVLDAVAQSYAGIDLGPIGYLGTGDELSAALAGRGLCLAGGFIDLPFADGEQLSKEMVRLKLLLDAFDAAPRLPDRPPPRPTLAAKTSEAHRLRPGAAAHDHTFGLDEDAWHHFADGVNQVVELCRTRGYEPTFHHHAATWVESPHEIQRVMELTDVGLCLDTGHLIVGGGEPAEAIAAWAERINHVHLKDIHRPLLDEIVRDGAPATEIWKRRVFCPLGQGDLDLAGVLEGLRTIGYHGWAVVEQDVFITDAADFESSISDQRSNRAALAALGI